MSQRVSEPPCLPFLPFLFFLAPPTTDHYETIVPAHVSLRFSFPFSPTYQCRRSQRPPRGHGSQAVAIAAGHGGGRRLLLLQQPRRFLFQQPSPREGQPGAEGEEDWQGAGGGGEAGTPTLPPAKA